MNLVLTINNCTILHCTGCVFTCVEYCLLTGVTLHVLWGLGYESSQKSFQGICLFGVHLYYTSLVWQLELVHKFCEFDLIKWYESHVGHGALPDKEDTLAYIL